MYIEKRNNEYDKALIESLTSEEISGDIVTYEKKEILINGNTTTIYQKHTTHIPTKFQEDIGSFYVLEGICILMLLCIGIIYWRNR